MRSGVASHCSGSIYDPDRTVDRGVRRAARRRPTLSAGQRSRQPSLISLRLAGRRSKLQASTPRRSRTSRSVGGVVTGSSLDLDVVDLADRDLVLDHDPDRRDRGRCAP